MNNTNNISDTVMTLSSFYELLLNIGKSLDIQENAEEFLKTLMLRKKLSFAGYFTIDHPSMLKKIYTIPKVKIDDFKIDADLFKGIVKNKFIILNDRDPGFKHFDNLTQFPTNEFVLYFTGIKSIIILAKKSDAFAKQNLIKYELVLNHFGLFMESLESHHNIKDEIKIKEEQAKIIEQNNEQLKKQNDDLLNYIRSNNELEQFAYRVSHDLNGPLRTIIEFSKILKSQSGEKLSKEQNEYLELIVNNGHQMKELIVGILDYSKITGAKLQVKKINVLHLIENIRNLLYHSLKEVNGTIIVKDVPEYINADLTKMTQLFLNLISNSLKFKRENVDSEIMICGEQNKTDFTFSVSDNGVGIASESKDRIFELFTKAFDNYKTEGHGIGLSTCRNIVEQHNGKIWIESIPNEGSTFFFTIAIMTTIDYQWNTVN